MKTINILLLLVGSALIAPTIMAQDLPEEIYKTVEPTAEELEAWQELWSVCEFPWTGTLGPTNEIPLGDGPTAVLLREGDEVTVEWDAVNNVVFVNGQSIMDYPPFDPNDDNMRPKRPEKYSEVPFVQALLDSVELGRAAELYLIEKKRVMGEANGEYVRMVRAGATLEQAAVSAAELIKGSLLVKDACAVAMSGPDGKVLWQLVTEWHGYRNSNQLLVLPEELPLGERRPTTRRDACYYLHRIQEMCIVPQWGTSLRTNCTFTLNHKSSSLQDR
ncbi:MAG: hypothetical protein KAY24_02775 [Candidatus Eisenbacteria sp.]|nr:hypothetical protein [Candidatus Eisenbacteria bacterium]